MNCFRGNKYQPIGNTTARTTCTAERQFQTRDLKIRQLEALNDAILQEQKKIYLRDLQRRKYKNDYIRSIIISAENIEELNMFWKLVTADD